MNGNWIWIALFVFAAAACGQTTDKKSPQGNNQNNANNINNSEACGNAAIDPGELCDSGIESGEGSCPTSCAAPACSTVMLQGSVESCTAECVVEPIACANDDGCCPIGCDMNTDNDCTNICGDNVIEDPEKCDGDCPTSCEDMDACTTDTINGDVATCSAECQFRVVTACNNGDGCCPAGCSASNDDDCEPISTCGNGDLDQGELCDGDCPTSCSDGEACTSDQIVGTAQTCDSRCIFTPINACISNDNCCPTGCDFTVDDDCSCTPDTCAGLGYNCGTHDDGCMGTINCGVCNDGTCNAGVCNANPGDGAVGDACTAAADCASDPNNPLGVGSCLMSGEGYPGGYCSMICIPLFLGCVPGAACVSDVGGQTGQCFKECVNSNQCRTGYSCQNTGAGLVCLPN